VTGVVRSRVTSADDADVLASIAEDYYVNGHNQDAIASRYSISRSYVSRLLRRAREIGVVEILVHRDIRRDAVLEAALQERFHLTRCIVVADVAMSPDGVLRQAGQLAARLLAEIITPESTLGLAWGNGVRAGVTALTPGRTRARRVVQMFGGLSTAPAEIMSGELVTEAARALDATPDRLHAPWIVESAELARSLLDQQDIAAVLRRAAGADVALVGIGATGRSSSALLFNERYLSGPELREIADQGAVGDICGRLFDVEGLPCRASVMSRVIGLELDTIRQLPLVVGVATGRVKARAIRAALRGSLVRALVTDGEAAREVLSDERN
jgi:deoxyribonucleoside regulator